MFAHGLITAVLFMMCGIVQHKTGTRNIPRLGGLAAKMPYAAVFMMIGFMASLGLPGMVGFVAEFCVFTATFDAFGWLLLMPIISVAITAAYYIWAMQRTLFGPLTKEVDTGTPPRPLLVRDAAAGGAERSDRAVRYVARVDNGLHHAVGQAS